MQQPDLIAYERAVQQARAARNAALGRMVLSLLRAVLPAKGAPAGPRLAH